MKLLYREETPWGKKWRREHRTTQERGLCGTIWIPDSGLFFHLLPLTGSWDDSTPSASLLENAHLAFSIS